MKKVISKGLVLCMSFLVLFSGMYPAQANTVHNKEISNVSTPQEYIKWVESKSSKDDKNSKVLKQFKALSTSQQQEFVNYINDEKLMSEIMDKFSTNISKSNYSETLKNGDVKIAIGQDVENKNIEISPLALPSRRVMKQASATIMGVDILLTQHEMTYTVSGTKVGTITHASHFVVHNYNPVLSLSWGNIWNRTYGSQAASSNDLSFSIIIKGVFTMGTKRITIWGNTSGVGRLEVVEVK